MDEPYRATRDVDLLAFEADDEEKIRSVMTTVCNVSCPEDGLVLDISTLNVSTIRDDQRYGGQRATLIALLGTAKCNIQVDFGFGDVVIPNPIEEHLPTLIEGVPPPVLQTYPKEAVIAEKFEAMIQLGSRNTRMKDFYDVWALSEIFPFDGALLREAAARCFERRNTPWTDSMPDALTSAFFSDPGRQELWGAYGRRGEVLSPPPQRL